MAFTPKVVRSTPQRRVKFGDLPVDATPSKKRPSAVKAVHAVMRFMTPSSKPGLGTGMSSPSTCPTPLMQSARKMTTHRSSPGRALLCRASDAGRAEPPLPPPPLGGSGRKDWDRLRGAVGAAGGFRRTHGGAAAEAFASDEDGEDDAAGLHEIYAQIEALGAAVVQASERREVLTSDVSELRSGAAARDLAGQLEAARAALAATERALAGVRVERDSASATLEAVEGQRDVAQRAARAAEARAKRLAVDADDSDGLKRQLSASREAVRRGRASSAAAAVRSAGLEEQLCRLEGALAAERSGREAAEAKARAAVADARSAARRADAAADTLAAAAADAEASARGHEQLTARNATLRRRNKQLEGMLAKAAAADGLGGGDGWRTSSLAADVDATAARARARAADDLLPPPVVRARAPAAGDLLLPPPPPPQRTQAAAVSEPRREETGSDEAPSPRSPPAQVPTAVAAALRAVFEGASSGGLSLAEVSRALRVNKGFAKALGFEGKMSAGPTHPVVDAVFRDCAGGPGGVLDWPLAQRFARRVLERNRSEATGSVVARARRLAAAGDSSDSDGDAAALGALD